MTVKFDIAPVAFARKALWIAAAGIFAVVLVAPLGLRSQEAVQVLRVLLDKSTMLQLNGSASIITVGEPTVADVTVVSPRMLFVLGRKIGETNLIVLDSKGGQVAAYDIVVVPETERHVTIHKSTDGVVTLSCDPRCTGVKNPGNEKNPDSSGGAASAAGGAPSGASGSAGGAADALGGAANTGAAPMPSQSYSNGTEK